MFPQAFPCPEIYVSEVSINDLATNAFPPVMCEHDILMGELTYNYLANITFNQWGGYWSGPFPQPEYTYNNTGYLSPASPPSGYGSPASSIDATFPFPPSPSPSPSQASSTSDYHQSSPEPSYTPKWSCRTAAPAYDKVLDKWFCNACNRPFRGKWECKRHIKSSGKRAKCLACGSKFIERKDSRKRHFREYCKGKVANLRFEDAFVEL